MFTILGHLGVWAGCYALAAFICFFQLTGTFTTPLPRWEAMFFVLFTATGVYSLDRVKLFSKWIDQADIAAQPERYRFLTRRPGAVRSFAVSVLLIAAVVGYCFHPFAPVLVGLAAVGTVIYAPKARNSIARVKDRLWLKNAYVALGMAAFAAVLTVLSDQSASFRNVLQNARNSEAALGLAFAIVFSRIFFDAALCDIDDESTDRRFRTETFATRLGAIQVWNWAGIGRFVMAGALLFARPIPFPARVAWSGAMLLGMIALRWQHPARIRDTVDIRFLPEAGFATLVLFLIPFSPP